ncbi:MAG: chorismate synthase [Treponema sp.]|jgi:chorismate synthase|nr:chorismate synthase [Treponema sp.]
MGGNSFGSLFRVITFGESHGPALGCVVDGCPAGLALSVDDIRRDLGRRRPGARGPAADREPGASTARSEADEPEILSGIFDGKTLGTPIAIVVRNADHRSSDYDELKDLYRPGHGDLAWEAKFGIRDHRGGGRSSGRETLGRVAAGAVARVFLAARGVVIRSWVSSIAGIDIPGPAETGFDIDETERNPFRIPRPGYVDRVRQRIEALREEGDSAGGIVSCVVSGLPAGLGEPVFDRLDARLAAAVLSIGASRGVEFGAGFGAAGMRGSEHNDIPLPGGRFRTNHAGGSLGGISTGQPVEFSVVFKPTPSIAKKQETVDREDRARELVIRGRHDTSVVPRAAPVVEAMAALVLADLVLLDRSARL